MRRPGEGPSQCVDRVRAQCVDRVGEQCVDRVREERKVGGVRHGRSSEHRVPEAEKALEALGLGQLQKNFPLGLFSHAPLLHAQITRQ